MSIYDNKMLALHLLGKGRCEVRETEIPIPGDNEVLIRVCTSAICGSEKPHYYFDKDIDILSGHETTGIVADASRSKHLIEGDRVALYALYGCGQCYYCKNGMTQFCVSFDGVANSGHSEYTACRDTNCLKIPDDITFDTAALLFGDTLGVAHRAMKRTQIKKDSTAYVIGAGPIGLGITAYLKYKGVKVIASELVEYRREFIKKELGADLVLDPNTEQIEELIKDETDGLGPEYVFECTGNSLAEISALSIVSKFGTVCFAGENFRELGIIPSEHIIHKEINLTGAFYYSPADVPNVVADYKNGLKADNLVSHRFNLKNAQEAFSMFMKGITAKVLIHPDD